MNKLKLHFLIIFLFIFLLQGCNSLQRTKEDPQKERISLTIAYQEDSLIHLPLYVAQAKNFFKDEGLTVQLQTSATSQERVAGLIGGQYDLLISGPEVGFYVYQQENQDKLVYLGQTAAKDGFFLLSRKEDENFTWSNVQGKVIIGAETGTYQEIILEDILRINKVRPFLDVHLTNNLPLSLHSGVFNSGTGHYLLVDEPRATSLERENSSHIAAYLGEHHNINLSSVVVAVKNRVHKEKEPYQKFIKALHRALLWIDEHSPEELTSIAMHYFPDQEEKNLLRGICRYKNQGCWPETPLLSEKELLKFQKIMLAAKELNSAIPINELIEPSFAQTAIKSKLQLLP